MTVTSEAIKNIRELERMRAELDQEIEAAKDEIKRIMDENKCYEYSGLDFKVTWKERTTNKIDTKALKAELPEICARFMRSTTSRTFLIN